MKKILLYLTIIGLILVSCNNDDDTKPQANQLELITGIKLIDNTGSIMEQYGNPNDSKPIQIRAEGRVGYDLNYAFYPNPVHDLLIIHSKETIKSVWTIPGKATNQFQDFDFEAYYQKTPLDTTNIFKHLNYSANSNNPTMQLNVNFSDKKPGFYKVVLETTNKDLVWFTLYKNDNPDDEGYIFW